MICRSCKSEKVTQILSLGDQYLSDFRTDSEKPKKYPLDLMFCRDCFFVQLKESAPLHEMYTPRYGFKSGVNTTIRNDLHNIVVNALEYLPMPEVEQIDNGETLETRPVVMDIGANDGTLLSNYPKSFFRIGIEPIEKLARECMRHANNIVNNFFNYEQVSKALEGMKADIITSISMFYDVEDPDRFVSEVKKCLSENGVWIIQQNYLLATIQENAVDNICHEHIGYHSLLSMEKLLSRHDLDIVDVSTSTINGGAFRIAVQHKGVGKIKPSVQKQRNIELICGLDTTRSYQDFADRVWNNAAELRKCIQTITDDGRKVFIYGASTRGGTIWQMAGLDVKLIPCAVDRNPEKVGKKIASIGVPIISEEEARMIRPDFMLVSIWFFKDEILEREKEYLAKGGHLIFPLPHLEII